MNPDEKLLFKAIKEDSLEKLASALSRGVKLNKLYEEYKFTPLLYAVKQGNENMVMTLLEQGADIHMRGLKGETPLFLACYLGKYGVAELLLEYGARPDVGALGGPTPLNAAIFRRDLNMVKLLLRKGANVNYNAYQLPLNTAIEFQAYEILEELLHKGANPNLYGAPLQIQAPPLIFAIERNSARSVKLLLDRGADIEIKYSLRPPLHYAAMQNSQHVKLLCEKGALVNFQDELYSTTALMIASGMGKVESVRILCEYGANKNLVSKSGKRAVDYVDIDSNEGNQIFEILDSCGVSDPTLPNSPPIILNQETNEPQALEILETDPRGGRRTRRRKSSNRSRKH